MVLLDTGTPGTSREIYSEESILTVYFSTDTRSSCVQQNHYTSRMRSQSQLRNDKFIMMLLNIVDFNVGECNCSPRKQSFDKHRFIQIC